MLKNKKNVQLLVITLVCVLAINWLSEFVYKRFDLTQDKRFTLSEAAKTTIATVDTPMAIDIFLEGKLPAEFKRLKIETEQLLKEFSAYNSNIKYRFIDPLEDTEYRNAIQQQMVKLGLKGAQVEIRENGKISTETVYPWALAYFNERTVPIPLLKNTLGASTEERVNNSIQNLEYAFADGFSKLTQPKRRKIAVLKGNSELDDRYIADLIKTLREYYYIGKFTMDSVSANPQRTLRTLMGYDLLVIAQPQQAFTENEKYVLDQYTMNGGASLWMIDATVQKLDTVSGNSFIFSLDLGLNDFFFKYGVRVNSNLIKAVPSAFIVLASGQERDSQYNRYPWLYSPLSSKNSEHPITTNIEAVKFDYVSTIDTLPNELKKTILLSSSPFSKIVGLPVEINIDKEIPENLKIVNDGPSPQEFNRGQIPMAVLIEGEFPSVYANRIKPFRISEDKEKSVLTKMVVISDGDVIRNQLDRNRPLELGFDKWTNTFYGNKEFLLNTVNYLLDDSGLINIRSKEIAVPFLDPQRTADKRTQWQVINLLLPLAVLALFGIFFRFIRKRRYAVISTDPSA
ncbi:MAG: gliding motility-associated ABC transporter substrate-binding protein GldG [Bacteroidetes bacterium]|nr:gliding motility-associated ABC transporter substrate-binding protein GldG [Bacteroidota bacterium]